MENCSLCTCKTTSVGSYKQFYSYIDNFGQSSYSISVVYFDIDHIKTFALDIDENEIIKYFSELICQVKNEFDMAFRVESHKFVIVSRETNVGIITSLSNKIKRSFEANFANKVMINSSQSMSIGLAISRPNEDLNECLRRADRSLYISKNQSPGVLIFSK